MFNLINIHYFSVQFLQKNGPFQTHSGQIWVDCLVGTPIRIPATFVAK
jgi:hypothetical protein